MIIERVDPDDPTAVAALAELANVVRRADSPWEHPMTLHEATGRLRHGWDGTPSTMFLGRIDGTAVATGEYDAGAWDNQHLAWSDVQVHPEHRRLGLGSEMLAALRSRAADEGRTTLSLWGWESAERSAFAARHGLEQKSVEVCRRQVLADLDRAALDAAYASALPHAADYELLRLPPRSDEALLPALGELTAAINDAPTDDLDIEDEVFPPERIRAYEDAQHAQGHLLHRVVARHRATGRLAGQSIVAVDLDRPTLAEQHDTSVVAAHRGHRLGLLLKLEMLRWLAEEQPQVASIDTWNAESNDRMIGVNELLGYRVVGRSLVFQGPAQP